MLLKRRDLLLAAPLLLAGEHLDAQTFSGFERISLPDDESIAAHVGVFARFEQFRPLRGQREMRLTANVLAFPANLSNPFTPETFTTRLLSQFEVPNEAGWGQFGPTGDTFRLTFDITDARMRLGSVVVREWESGRVVGSVRARGDGAQVRGEVGCDWDASFFLLEGKAKTGKPLFALGVQRGFPDYVVSVSLEGEFQPRRPASVLLPGMNECPDVSGLVGHAYNDDANVALAEMGAGVSRACAVAELINDTFQTQPFMPPASFQNLRRYQAVRQIAGAGLNTTRHPPGLPPALTAAATSAKLLAFGRGDFEAGVRNAELPPFSRVVMRWSPELHGRVLGVLLVPYERIKHTLDFWDLLRPTLSEALAAQTGQFSHLAAFTANRLLQERVWQQRTGLMPGDVSAGGENYAVQVVDRQAIVQAAPILEDVHFQVMSYFAPPGDDWEAEVVVENAGAYTTPPPPGKAEGGTIKIGPKGGVLALAKGYSWRVTGRITHPAGYGSETRVIRTPPENTVMLPVPLEALWHLKVVTNGPQGSIAARVLLRTRDGKPVAEQNSVLDTKMGIYSATFNLVPPGIYALQAFAPGLQSPEYINTASIDKESVVSLPLVPAPPPEKARKPKAGNRQPKP